MEYTVTTVRDIYNIINDLAPFALAEEWDNAGLLAGSMDAPVQRILCALELNDRVLHEAIDRQVQMVVTHHPIMFRGRKNLREDDAEGRLLCGLVRANIALIAAHTNFDAASPGVNDALAERLELCDAETVDDFMRIGTTDKITFGSFAEFAGRQLGDAVRRYGDANRKIRRVAVVGGAGEDYVNIAREHGADVYLTGEIAHHIAWSAVENGMCVLEAGHAATELPAISLLADGLQKAANDIQYNLEIFLSETELFE